MKKTYPLFFVLLMAVPFSGKSISSSFFLPDTTLPVGAIPASYDVSGSGAATYSVPLYIPPGTLGVQPQVSIVYNSQGGNGLLGSGWDLAGLSAITRVPQNFYHDENITPISFTSTDRFALDGNRLLCLQGSYGTDLSVYGTELIDFSRITCYEDPHAPEAASWFKVETSNGWVLEYGHASHARIYPHGGNIPYMWRLNKATDPNGNYILYEYGTDFGESFIQSIRYTGNEQSGLQTYNSLEFSYTTKQNPSVYFTGGHEIAQSRLLQSITVKCEGSVIKTYGLGYESNTNFTHLLNINEYDGSGTPLNPTRIEWGNTGAEFINQMIYSQQNLTEKTYTGDFNGDGKADLLILRQIDIYTLQCIVSLSNGTSFINDLSIPIEGDMKIMNVEAVVGDFNGDGKDDFLFYKKTGTYQSNYSSRAAFECIPFLSHSFDYPYFIRGSSFSISRNESLYGALDELKLFASDFNGDGKAELLAAHVNCDHVVLNNPIYSYYLKIFSWENIGFSEKSTYYFRHLDFYSVLDYDGDGRSEIVTVDGNTMSIFRALNPVPELIYTHNGFPTKDHRVYLGDFNGDGKTDILSYYNRSGEAGVLNYSNGKGLHWPATQTNLPSKSDDYTVYPADFDGEGKTDLLYVYKSGSAYLYLNKGNGNFTVLSLGLTGASVYPGDYNGDGRMDILFKDPYTGQKRIIYCYMDDQRNLAHQITDGMGSRVSFAYKRLNEDPSLYQKRTDAVYPLSDYNGALQVVASLTLSNPSAGNETSRYTYAGARIHRKGKGFLGFAEVSVSNTFRNRKSVNTYQIHPTLYYPYLQKSSLYRISNPYTLLSETAYTYAYLDGGWNRFYPYVQTSLFRDHVRGEKQTTENVCNAAGIIYQSTRRLYKGVNASTAEVEEYKGSRWIKTAGQWVPVFDTLKLSKDRQTETQTNQYQYDAYGRLLSHLQVYADPDLNQTTSYTYTTEGNLQTLTTTTRAGSRTQSFAYDSRGRWKTKSTDPDGTTIEYQYKAAFGKLSCEIAPGNLRTNYVYDSRGKLTKVIYPDQSWTVYDTWWVNNVPGALYYTKTIHQTFPESYAFYDAAGREVLRYTTADKGLPLFWAFAYDAYGRLYKKSNPFNRLTEIGQAAWTFYTYDEYNRLISEKGCQTGDRFQGTPNTVDRSWSYGNYLTVFTDHLNGITQTKHYDVQGNLVTAVDEGGTLQYTYFPMGNLKTVSAPGAVTSLTYDPAGNRASINEPNAGTTSYTYNGFGELIRQVDANRCSTSYLYSPEGRLLSETITQGSQTYTTSYTYYNTTDALNGRLYEVRNNACTTSFQYDRFGRKTAVTEKIDGKEFTSSFQYDTYRKLDSLTYPSLNADPLKVNFDYDRYTGGLSQISYNRDQTLWIADGFYTDGLPAKASFGNGLSSWYTYNQLTQQLTAMRTGTKVEVPCTVDKLDEPYITELHYWAPGMHPSGLAPEWSRQPIMDSPNIMAVSFAFKNTRFTQDPMPESGIASHAAVNVDVCYSARYINNWEFEYKKGLMIRRTEKSTNQSETFEYDKLQRLTKAQNTSFDYDVNGNLMHKSDVGNFRYDMEKPHALKSVTLNENSPYIQHGFASEGCYTAYTLFHKVERIENEEGDVLGITYGTDKERIRSVLKRNGVVLKTTYFIGGNYELEVLPGKTRELHYVYGDLWTGVYVKDSEKGNRMYYVFTDHLGSFDKVTDESGEVVEMYSFDAWGNRRNPENWQQGDTRTGFLFSRGFTGHEHLDGFKLINMNGRLYDPVVGRFFSPDPYVQAPDFTQNFNRYSYCLNNPLMYTDPSGENPLLIALGVYALFCTDVGFDVQKFFSPVAFKLDFNWGSDIKKIGFDVSVGIPQAIPVSYRTQYGKTYYKQYYDNSYIGWEIRNGHEWSFIGLVKLSQTTHSMNSNNGELNQITGMLTLGIHGLNVKIDNDLLGDGGDRWRTAAVKVQLGLFSLGTNLFTGDPGFNNPRNINEDIGGLGGQYMKNNYGDDPDKYRAGIFYLGIGPFKIGLNSEGVRDAFQNKLIHDWAQGMMLNNPSPHFKFDLKRKARFYWELGYSSGNTLW